MKRISAILDPNGNSLIGLNSSDYIDCRILAAGVAEVHTIQTGAKYVLFSATAPFYAKMNGLAAVPTIDITDGSGCMLNPELRSIGTATTIGIISSTTCIVTLEFYS